MKTETPPLTPRLAGLDDDRGLRAVALARLPRADRRAAQALIGRLLDAAPAGGPARTPAGLAAGEGHALLEDLRYAAGWVAARSGEPALTETYGEVARLIGMACARLAAGLSTLPRPEAAEGDESDAGEGSDEREWEARVDAVLLAAGDLPHPYRHAARAELPEQVFQSFQAMAGSTMGLLLDTDSDAVAGARQVVFRDHLEAVLLDLRATQYSFALPLAFATFTDAPAEPQVVGLLPLAERLDRLALDLAAYLATLSPLEALDPQQRSCEGGAASEEPQAEAA